MKKGQITLFILIGVLILLLVGLIFYFVGIEKEAEEITEIPLSFVPIKDFVESCIQKVGKDALVFIGKRGGYYDLPLRTDPILKTAYYFYLNKSIMPSKERVEEELVEYMNEELFFCVRNFVEFEKMGFDIEQGDIVTETRIVPGAVNFRVNFPLTIRREAVVQKIDEFFIQIPIRLDTIYELSSKMIQRQVETLDSVCLSCIIEWSIEYDFLIDMFQIGNDSILFEIVDNKTQINDKPYIYRFINKYQLIPVSPTPLEVVIQEISDQGAIAGYLYVYKIKATGTNVTFSSDNDLFEISKNGLINFTPQLEQVGVHLIVINAEDVFGNTTMEMFKLNITFYNANPVIEYIGYQTAIINQLFTYKVNVTDPDNNTIIGYLDDTDLFDITSTGLINFTPTIEQRGTHKINITSIDELGGVDVEEMNLIIID